ncbi:hypothetical protein M405DRAFT_488018 [Rhizopogon salebrosus TDB-379]|nr:hypothetical protein M405DRAFT_488018 [Rhizopogon salebrosus TDB-379]
MLSLPIELQLHIASFLLLGYEDIMMHIVVSTLNAPMTAVYGLVYSLRVGCTISSQRHPLSWTARHCQTCSWNTCSKLQHTSSKCGPCRGGST